MRKDDACRQKISCLRKYPQNEKNKFELAKQLRNLGWMRYKEKRYEDVIRYFRESAEIFSKLRELDEQAKVLRGQGICESSLGLNSKAIETFHKTEKILLTLKSEELKAKVYYVLSNQEIYIAKCLQGEGIILTLLGRYIESNKLLQESGEIFARLKDKWKCANINENISTNCYHLKEKKKALELINDAIEEYEKIGIKRSWAYFHRARNYEVLGEKKKAYKDYERAIVLVERERGEIRTDDFRSSFFDQKITIYDNAVRFLIDVGEKEKAYDLVRRCKARSFNETLEKRKDTVEIKDNKLIEKAEKLKCEIDILFAEINNPELEKKAKDNLKDLKESKKGVFGLVSW